MDRLYTFISKNTKNIPFYKDNSVYTDYLQRKLSFVELPIIRKMYVNENYDSFLSLEKGNERIVSNWTSGTTGVPLEIRWFYSDYIKSYYYLWNLRRKWYNILPSDKMCTFHSVTSNGLFLNANHPIIEKNKLSLPKGVYDESVLDYYSKIMRDFRPTWLLIPPSIAIVLLNYFVNKKIDFSYIKYIEFNGEFLNDSVISHLKSILPFAKFANLYGTYEFNGIAYSCPNNHMHIIEDNVSVESDASNNLFLTTITNRYMPLIRYEIGDVGKVYECNCSCCAYRKCLKIEYGRKSEVINMENYVIDTNIFNSIIEELNKTEKIVIQYQLVIKNNEIFLRILAPANKIRLLTIQKKHLMDLMKNNLRKKDVNFDIVFTSNPQNMLKSSKFSHIVYE